MSADLDRATLRQLLKRTLDPLEDAGQDRIYDVVDALEVHFEELKQEIDDLKLELAETQRLLREAYAGQQVAA